MSRFINEENGVWGIGVTNPEAQPESDRARFTPGSTYSHVRMSPLFSQPHTSNGHQISLLS